MNRRQFLGFSAAIPFIKPSSIEYAHAVTVGVDPATEGLDKSSVVIVNRDTEGHITNIDFATMYEREFVKGFKHQQTLLKNRGIA
jgi:hypothetical protein